MPARNPCLAPVAPVRDGIMNTRHASNASRPTGFSGETLRALASALLLLGLIGDRRAR